MPPASASSVGGSSPSSPMSGLSSMPSSSRSCSISSLPSFAFRSSIALRLALSMARCAFLYRYWNILYRFSLALTDLATSLSARMMYSPFGPSWMSVIPMASILATMSAISGSFLPRRPAQWMMSSLPLVLSTRRQNEQMNSSSEESDGLTYFFVSAMV